MEKTEKIISVEEVAKTGVLNDEELTPTEYFDFLKGHMHEIDDKELKNLFQVVCQIFQNCLATRQIALLKKLMFLMKTFSKEVKLVSMGFDKFIYYEDISEYIDDVGNNVVKIIELENYPRVIPNEVADALLHIADEEKKTKTKLFSHYYVVYTDYTGKDEKKVEQARRDKDPILFGTFMDLKERSMINRFYYIADWEDEYCDLTLAKMIDHFAKKGKEDVVKDMDIPKDSKELEMYLKQLEDTAKDGEYRVNKKKKGMFRSIKTVFSK